MFVKKKVSVIYQQLQIEVWVNILESERKINYEKHEIFK